MPRGFKEVKKEHRQNKKEINVEQIGTNVLRAHHTTHACRPQERRIRLLSCTGCNPTTCTENARMA
jgi:hypothetical protein